MVRRFVHWNVSECFRFDTSSALAKGFQNRVLAQDLLTPRQICTTKIEGVALFSAVVAQLRAFHNSKISTARPSAFCSLSKSCRR